MSYRVYVQPETYDLFYGVSNVKVPEQGPPIEQDPQKPLPPVPEEASPVYSPRPMPAGNRYGGQVPQEQSLKEPVPKRTPNAPTPATPEPARVPYGQSPEAKQAAETRAEQIIDRREALQLKIFGGQMRTAEAGARDQFQRDLLVVKAKELARWQFNDTEPASGFTRKAWTEEWNKYEAGESSSFEDRLSKWKLESRASAFNVEAGPYKDYVNSVLNYVSYHEPSLEQAGAYEKAEERAAHGASYGLHNRVGGFDIRTVARAAKMGLLPEQHVYSPEEIKAYEAWEERGAHGPKSFMKAVPFSPEQIGVYEAAEARAAHGASYGLASRRVKVLAFQGSRQSAVDRSDVSWKIDVKIHEPVTFGNEFSEEKLVPAVFGKDYDMRVLGKFARSLTSSPVFGKDYSMRDVGAWARNQSAPAFGVDYDMRDVGVWAKVWGQTSEGKAYLQAEQSAREAEAAYTAKQAVSTEFYTKLGYPQYGGKYEPFDVTMFPAGYDLNISETAEGLKVEPNIPKSITQRVSESRGGLFSNWLSGVTGLSKQPGYQNVEGMATVGQADLKPYFAEFIAPFEAAGVSLAKFAGVQGLQDVPSTALSSFLGSVKYGKQPLGLFERALSGGGARTLREAELLKGTMKPESLFLSPSPELLGYAVRPDLMLSSLLGEAALFYGESKLIQGVAKGVGKAAHGVYDWKIKGSSFEKSLVDWAWKDPGLAGFEKAGLEQVPHMDTSYLKSSQFLSGYEENTGLMSSVRGMVRGRLPLSELSVGLPTLPGYVPGAAEEALVKGSIGLGGYDMKWLPRLQAGLEFGDMMASPGAAGFGLTVPAPLAAVGVSNVGRVYAFELMKMPAGFASGFTRSTADKWADVGFIDDSSKYDMSMSKGGRFFKESMPSNYLGGFSKNDYPLLEVTRYSGLRSSRFIADSQFGFVKSGGKALSDAGLQSSLMNKMFRPAVETMRLSYLPLTESQLAGRAFLKFASLPALSLTFASTVSSWASQPKLLPMYMQRTMQRTKQTQQQQYMDETQFLSYPGVDVGYQQTMQPSQRFKESEALFGLQQSRFVSGWQPKQREQQTQTLKLLEGYSVKPYLESASLLRLPSMRESLQGLPQLDYGVQSTKSQFQFGLSGFGLDLGASAGSREIMRSVEAQTQKLYVGQKPLQLQVQKTLVLIKPAAEVGLPQYYSPFEDVGYKKRKQRKTRMIKQVGFGKFLRVTPVMTAKEYRKMMLG